MYKACAESYEKKLNAEYMRGHIDGLQGAEIVDGTGLLKQQLSEANARNAMLVGVLKYVLDDLTLRARLSEDDSLNIGQGCLDKMHEAITANSESVAAWEAEKLEPLHTKLSMYEAACEGLPNGWIEHGVAGCIKNVRDERDAYLSELEPFRREVAMLRNALVCPIKGEVAMALEASQATAEAYEREVQIAMLERLKRKYSTDSNGCYIHSSCMDAEIASIRAANKGKE